MLAIRDLGNISDTVDLIVPAINISSPNEVIYASDILSKYKPEDVFLHIKKDRSGSTRTSKSTDTEFVK